MAKKQSSADNGNGAAPGNGGTRYKWPDEGFTAIPGLDLHQRRDLSRASSS